MSVTTKSAIALFVLGSFVAGYYAVSLVKKYPWSAPRANFSEAKSSVFFEPWPLSSMEEERLARKNLRRFPKAEQQRRQEVQLRRMKIVNSALSDIFVEGSAQFIPKLDSIFGAIPGVPWPALELTRALSNEGQETRNLSYVVQPGLNTTGLSEAVLVRAGEEIKISFAITKNRRTIAFDIFPLVPSNVRALVGQYSSWGKSFTDDEVNTVNSFQIPIGDATAGTLRLQCGVGSFYLLQAKVTQREGNGRMPIQVATESPMWRTNPLYFTTSTGDVREPDEAEMEATEGEAEVAVPTPAAGPVEHEKTAPVAAQQLPIEIPDGERANTQLQSSNGRTTALGYNVVLFQLESIPWEVVSDPVLFKMLAPNLAAFAQSAFSVAGKLDVPENSVELFRRTILGNEPSKTLIENNLLLRQFLLNSKVYNLYARMRSFGYHVAGIASPEAYGGKPALSLSEGFPRLAGRWLSESDWTLFRKRREIDAVREPVSGLDAVFPTKNIEVALPVSDGEFASLGRYLQNALGNSTLPDWRANEMFFPDGSNIYFAKVVDTYQTWIKDNAQTRFLLHVNVDGRGQKQRSNLRDFWKVIKVRRIRAFTDAKRSEQFARIVSVDRAFGQMVDALAAKRLEHRTIVSVVLPHTSQLGTSSQGASFFMKVPGLLPKKDKFVDHISLDDVVSTLVTTVGIPLGENVSDTVEKFAGQSLELPFKEKVAENEVPAVPFSVHQYHLYIFPSKTGCEPFEWHSDVEMFGIEPSQPIVEIDPLRKKLRIYPCAITHPMIRLSWFENLSRQEAAEAKDENEKPDGANDLPQEKNLLGGFFYAGSKVTDFSKLPLFLFGRHFFKVTDVPFGLKNLADDELRRIFDIDDKLDSNDETVLKRKLDLMSKMMSETDQKRTIAFFARSRP